MATYTAVMRQVLEYASTIWSPLASSTSINKLQVMQNAVLRTTTESTQDTCIQNLHDETLTLPIHEHTHLHNSQYKHKTQHPSHPLHKHTTYFNTPRQRNPLYLTTAATQQTFPQTPHSHYNRHKTKMRYIHTSIVSRHLATRVNNEILRIPPSHSSSSEEIHPRFIRRTLAQLRTNKSPFLKSYLHKVDAKSHPSPLFPLCNTHLHNTHHLINCTHVVTPGFVDRPHRIDCTVGQMDGEDGWWTTRGKIGLPPQWIDNNKGDNPEKMAFMNMIQLKGTTRNMLK